MIGKKRKGNRKLPGGACSALITTRRCCLRSCFSRRSVWHGSIIITVIIIIRRDLLLIVLAFRRRHTSPRPPRPVVFRRGGFADGQHPVISDSTPVLAAGGAFAARSAVLLIARVMHAYWTVRPRTSVAAREYLCCRCVSIPDFFFFRCGTHLEADRTIYNFFWIGGLEVGL
jgi:hypothetical protein